MTNKTGGLREINWNLDDSWSTILPKRNVKSKCYAKSLLTKFQYAERQYLEAFKNGKVYKTKDDSKLDIQDSKFVVDTMYEGWFVGSDIFDKIRVLTD